MTTATDATTLAALDFTPAWLCEILHGIGGQACGVPAGWVAWLQCTSCALDERLLLCGTHHDGLYEPRFLIVGTCDRCGFEGVPWLAGVERLL